jgi:hypothetical protein
MIHPSVGDIVLLQPHTPLHYLADALVIEVADEMSFCLAAIPDTYLAGHLDLILGPAETGLTYGTAILSHIGVWVDNYQVNSIEGRVTQDVVVAISNARLGIPPTVGRVGVHSLDPAFDPRWPALKAIAEEFGLAFSITLVPNPPLMDFKTFKARLSALMRRFEEVLDQKQRFSDAELAEIKITLIELGDWIEQHPDSYSMQTFVYQTDPIQNAVRRRDKQLTQV